MTRSPRKAPADGRGCAFGGWLAGRNHTLRLLPGRVNGDFLLADDRYLIARQGERWLLLDHPPTVLTLRQQLSLALQSVR